MLRLRVVCEANDRSAVVDLLDAEPGVAHVAVAPGVSRQPLGDVIEATIAREAAEDVVHRLEQCGVNRHGEISLESIELVISETAQAAERAAPGAGADAVIWEELVATTGEESELNPVFIAFLTIGCLLAAIGVVTNSPITIVGAMVVSPDFGPLAALAVAVVSRQRRLASRGMIALGVGYPTAILVTVLLAALARGIGLYDAPTLTSLDQVSFVYHVGPSSAIVALLAGVAGMLALTSNKSGVLIGVFISVTTVPAAGFAAVAAVNGDWAQCGEAILQLLVNLAGIAIAGTLALSVRRRHIAPAAGISSG